MTDDKEDQHHLYLCISQKTVTRAREGPSMAGRLSR